MSDAFIRLPLDGPGKRIDAEDLTVASLLVHRERMQIAGAIAAEIARVVDTDPAATDHGLVVRESALVSPQTSVATVATRAGRQTG